MLCRVLSVLFLGAWCCSAAQITDPTQEELLKSVALLKYGNTPAWVSLGQELERRVAEMREVRTEKLSEDAYLVRFESGHDELNEAPYANYALVLHERGKWWAVQYRVLDIACDNVATHRWDGTVLHLLSATGHLVADMAVDGSYADAPQYVQLRYLGFEPGSVRVEVHNTLDVSVRLLPGRFTVNGLVGQPAMCDMVYRALLREECELQPHETRLLELSLSINSVFNSPYREGIEISEPYVTYVALPSRDSARAGAHEYVPYVIRRAGSPTMASLPLCEDYVWKLDYDLGRTSGVDSSVRTVQLWRREKGRWHLLSQVADSAYSEARFTGDDDTYRLSGQVLSMGKPKEQTKPRVDVLLPLPGGSREVELLPDHVLDISMCLNTGASQAPETWYLRHGELRLPVEVARVFPAEDKIPPSLRHLPRPHRLVFAAPAANGERYSLTLAYPKLRVLVCDANADGIPDVKIADSDYVLYGLAEGGGCFRCPVLDARAELTARGLGDAWWRGEHLKNAVQAGDVELLRLLLAADGKGNVATGEPLLLAAMNGQGECVELLLEVNDVYAERRGDLYRAVAAASAGDVATLQALLEAGLEAHCTLKYDSEEHTLLHAAVRHNRAACVRLLLEQSDTDAEVTDSSGLTPLQLAEQLGHTACAELLRTASEDEE